MNGDISPKFGAGLGERMVKDFRAYLVNPRRSQMFENNKV